MIKPTVSAANRPATTSIVQCARSTMTAPSTNVERMVGSVTATTGGLLNERFDLRVHCLMSGPLGGDLQIGALVANVGGTKITTQRASASPAVDVVEVYPYVPYIQYLLPGSIVMSIFMMVMIGGGIIFIDDKARGLHEGYLVTPIKRLELIAGFNLSGTLKAVLAGAVLMTIGSLIAGVPNQMAHVTCDGLLSACCFGHSDRWTMADLRTTGFVDAWNCASFRELRRAHLARDVRVQLRAVLQAVHARRHADPARRRHLRLQRPRASPFRPRTKIGSPRTNSCSRSPTISRRRRSVR